MIDKVYSVDMDCWKWHVECCCRSNFQSPASHSRLETILLLQSIERLNFTYIHKLSKATTLKQGLVGAPFFLEISKRLPKMSRCIRGMNWTWSKKRKATVTSEREEQKPRSWKKQRTLMILTTFEEKNKRGMVALYTVTLLGSLVVQNARKSVIGFL